MAKYKLLFLPLRRCAVESLITWFMECRSKCGACCIALSISTPIPGMPEGKPAGVKCIHLLDDYKCNIYTYSVKPRVCSNFKPEPEFCGSSQEEALKILYSLSE